MALITASMKTELQKKAPDIYSVLDVEFTSGTKRYLGNRVIQWPVITRTVGDDSLESVSFSVTIDDTDFDFSNLIGTDGITALRGVDASIMIASPNVTEANWFTCFSGEFVGFQPAGPLQYRFDFRNDDKQLEHHYPKTIVSLTDWPNADAAAIGAPVPLIIGVHNAEGITTGGMVPVLYVDDVGFRYMVAAGYVQVDNVYKDGVEQTTGWAETHVTVSGRDFTMIDFTTDQGTAEITANVTGYDTDADGTGTVLADPSAEIKHLLVNYIFGDHKTGAWLADSTAPINATHFTELTNFLTVLGAEGSRRIAGTQITGADTVNEFVANHSAAAFWQNDGKLAIRPDDPFITALYIDDAWVRWERQPGDPTEFSQEFTDDKIVDTLDVSYMYGEADAKYFDTLTMKDPSIAQDAREPIELVWSASRVQ